MRKKVITTLLLTCCLVLTAMFTLAGCGNSAEEEGPNEGNWADEEWEDEDWEEDDVWDPYKEGMTLEEAKEWEECTVFIMDNDMFYPLMPARMGVGCVGSNTTFPAEIDTAGFYYTTEEYAEYELPVFSGDAKLVEVQEEKNINTVIHLPGKTGWTIPYRFEIAGSTLSEEDEFNQYIEAWEGYDYSKYDIPDGVDIRRLKNKDLDFSELYHTAAALEEEIHSDELSKLNAQIEANSLKPVYIDAAGFNCTMVYDAKKGEEVELSYRESGSVDTETAYEYAYYRYFNLPTDITANKSKKSYEGKYVETEEGYSIIETETLDAGINIYLCGSFLPPYVFEVK